MQAGYREKNSLGGIGLTSPYLLYFNLIINYFSLFDDSLPAMTSLMLGPRQIVILASGSLC